MKNIHFIIGYEAVNQKQNRINQKTICMNDLGVKDANTIHLYGYEVICGRRN